MVVIIGARVGEEKKTDQSNVETYSEDTRPQTQ